MGEGADDALDYLSDLDDAHYRGEFDEETGEVVGSPFTFRREHRHSPGPKFFACKYCGQYPLIWQNTDNGWRLFSINGKNLHSCEDYNGNP